MLNLGVEGMMLVGAVAGFAATVHHRQRAARHRRGAAGRAWLLALIFGFLTLTLLANQVATGLALTIFGIGLSALLGSASSARRVAAAELACRASCRIRSWPVLFGQDALVYLSLIAVFGVAWFLQPHAAAG